MQIELFGNLRVVRDGQVVLRFRTQKAASLLAYLAYFQQRAHSREALIELVWPETDLDAGRNNLSVALSSLRRQLEPPGVPAGSVLLADRASVRLNPATVTTDVGRFEAALRAARQAGAAGAQAACLAEAVEWYRGPLLPGFYDEWIFPEQGRLAGMFFEALRRLLTHLEATGDLDGALAAARRAVSVDPQREEAHYELIRLLAVTGQEPLALRQYRELERILERSLDAVPGPATRALVRQIEVGNRTPVTSPVRPIVGDGKTRPPAGEARRPPGHPAAPIPAAPQPAAPLFQLPTGTVTFLLLEVEADERNPAGSPARDLEEPGERLRWRFLQHQGYEVRSGSGVFLVAFAHAGSALACALACAGLPSPGSGPDTPTDQHSPPAPVRLALDTGDVSLQKGAYEGWVLQHANRLLAAAHPGQILVSEPAAVLLRRTLAPGVRLADLGVYRLRGSLEPERLFQVEHAETAQEPFPPPKAERGYSSHLPPQVTRFFGRSSEIARLVSLLTPAAVDQGGEGSAERNGVMEWWSSGVVEGHFHHSTTPSLHYSRLVTLTGPGGTGKTRLALEVAARLVEPYEERVWSASLAETTDPQRLPDVIRDALRLPRAGGGDALEQVIEALSAGPSLLLLDNLEQLLQDPLPSEEGIPADELVGTLLERVPFLTLLVTSRQPLQLEGECEFPVAPLSIPAAPDPAGRAGEPAGRDATATASGAVSEADLALLAGNESIRLFVDRAQAVRPDFQVTRSKAAALAVLCRRLEGIPLALELAAARASVLTPAQMVAQLDRRFDFLVSRRRDLPARHRTLRAALDWSYHLLPEVERLLLARLSVFAGGFTLEAAAAVGVAVEADSSTILVETLDLVSQLVQKSLVTAELGGAAARYRLLELIREYGSERLRERGEWETLRDRHRNYFLHLAEEAEPKLTLPEQETWFNRLEEEHDNFRAALDWLVEAGRRSACPEGARSRQQAGSPPPTADCFLPTAACRLAGALWRFWYVRGYLNEARSRFAAVLALPAPTVTDVPEGLALLEAWRRARAKALTGAGGAARFQGDCVAARAYHEEALQLRRELGDRAGIGISLNNLANVAYEEGDYAASRRLHEEGLAIKRELGDRWGIGASLHNLATVNQAEGNLETARRLHEESLAIKRELGDPAGIAISLNNLGNTFRDLGDYATARRLHEESLAIKRELGERMGTADSLTNLGLLFLDEGNLAPARDCFLEAEQLYREVGRRAGVANTIQSLGIIAWLQGAEEGGRAFLEQGLALSRELDDRGEVAVCLSLLARIAVRRGRLKEAAALSRESLELRQGLENQAGTPESLLTAAAVACAQGRGRQAARLLGAREALMERLRTPPRHVEQVEYDRLLAALQAALPAETLEAALTEGRTLPREAAVQEALA